MFTLTDTPTEFGEQTLNTQHVIACHPYYQSYIDNYLTWTQKLIRRGGDLTHQHSRSLITYCHNIQMGLIPPIYNTDMYTHITDWLPDCFRPCNTLLGSIDGCDGASYDLLGLSCYQDMYLFAKTKYTELLKLMPKYPSTPDMYPIYVRNSNEVTYTNVYHNHYVVTSTRLLHIQCHPYYSNSYGDPINDIELNGTYLAMWRFDKLHI